MSVGQAEIVARLDKKSIGCKIAQDNGDKRGAVATQPDGGGD